MSITAAPAYVNPSLTAMSTPFISGVFPAGATAKGGTNFTIFEKCDIYLLGQKEATLSPAKEINEWWTANKAALLAAKMIPTTQVSSWAIVVDI